MSGDLRPTMVLYCNVCEADVDVPYLPTPLPGLSIADWTGHGAQHGVPASRCSLTHVRSGLVVLRADHPEVLAQACESLAGIDWTRTGAELHDAGDAKQAVAIAEKRTASYRVAHTVAPACDPRLVR